MLRLSPANDRPLGTDAAVAAHTAEARERAASTFALIRATNGAGT